MDSVSVIQRVFNDTILERNEICQERDEAYEENQILNERYQKLKQQMKELNEKYEKTHADLTNEKAEKNSMLQKYEEIQYQVFELKSEIESHACKMEHMKKKNATFAGMIECLTQENDKLKSNLEDSNIEKQTLKNKQKELCQKYNKKHTDFTNVQQEKSCILKENEDLRNEVSKLKSELENHVFQIKQMKETNGTYEGVIECLTKENNHLKNDLAEYEVKKQRLKKCYKELREKINAFRNCFQHSEQRYESVKHDFEVVCDQLDAKNRELALSNETVSNLKGRIQILMKELADVKSFSSGEDKGHNVDKDGNCRQICPELNQVTQKHQRGSSVPLRETINKNWHLKLMPKDQKLRSTTVPSTFTAKSRGTKCCRVPDCGDKKVQFNNPLLRPKGAGKVSSPKKNIFSSQFKNSGGVFRFLKSPAESKIAKGGRNKARSHFLLHREKMRNVHGCM